MKKLLAVLTGVMLISVAYILPIGAEALDAQEALTVWNSEGEYVGTVTNALVNSSGDIGFVIISMGEKGEGMKEIAVPAESFSTNGEKGLFLDVNKEKLAAAPEFKDSDLSNPNFAKTVYRFFGLMPSWTE